LTLVCGRIYAVLKHINGVVRCPNMAIQEADDCDLDDEDSLLSENSRSDVSFTGRPKDIRVHEKHDVRWLGNSIKADSRRKFYR
jgi:hypothetical protein